MNTSIAEIYIDIDIKASRLSFILTGRDLSLLCSSGRKCFLLIRSEQAFKVRSKGSHRFWLNVISLFFMTCSVKRIHCLKSYRLNSLVSLHDEVYLNMIKKGI